MRRKSFSFRLITLVIGVSLVHLVLSGPAVAAQQDNSSLVVSAPVVTVRRVEKKRRRPGKPRGIIRKPVERVPLLAVRLQLYLLKEDGSQEETSPGAQFFSGDRLRLGVTANQAGYLTIIRQPGRGQDGDVLFPTSLIENGINDVPANKEYIVPSNCPKEIKPRDCAYVMPESAGAELFTVIFSRDLILDLPENATTPTGSIKSEFIKSIEDSSVKQLKRIPSKNSRSAIQVINMNPKDNEEIFLRVPVTNRGPSPLRR